MISAKDLGLELMGMIGKMVVDGGCCEGDSMLVRKVR